LAFHWYFIGMYMYFIVISLAFLEVLFLLISSLLVFDWYCVVILLIFICILVCEWYLMICIGI